MIAAILLREKTDLEFTTVIAVLSELAPPLS